MHGFTHKGLPALLLPLVAVGMASPAICYSQEMRSGLTFDVASIKPAEFSNPGYGAGFAAGAARSPCTLGKPAVSGMFVSLTRVGVCDIIRIAYNMKSFQVFGVPPSLGYSSQENQQPLPTRFSGPPMKEPPPFYDIQARSPGTRPPNDEQVREMLRALLAERFALKLHRERRPLAFYALVAVNGGPKLKRATADCKPASKPEFIQICGCTMEQFAHFLNGKSDKPVVDMTHTAEKFDIELPVDKGSSDLSDISASMKKNLGLMLDARKDEIEVLIVDHAQKASVN